MGVQRIDRVRERIVVGLIEDVRRLLIFQGNQFEILGDEVVGSASLMGTARIISEGRAPGSNIS
jgi:hypothetical protein